MLGTEEITLLPKMQHTFPFLTQLQQYFKQDQRIVIILSHFVVNQ